jgi:hypothetical protein
MRERRSHIRHMEDLAYKTQKRIVEERIWRARRRRGFGVLDAGKKITYQMHGGFGVLDAGKEIAH